MSEPEPTDAAERQLDRELDDSSRNAGPVHASRLGLVAVVLVTSVIGGAAAYAIITMIVKFHASITWAYLAPAVVIAAFAWGMTGLNRDATRSDRLLQVVICAAVACLILVLHRPIPLASLFERSQDLMEGIAGVPRLHEIMAWSAVTACAAVAAAALVRMVLPARRSAPL